MKLLAAIALSLACAHVLPASDSLLQATHQNDLAAAAELIGKGASANAANGYGVTPLFPACENGNPRMVALLLTAGAEVNASQPNGETPLMTAARTGDAECVQLLIDAGANLDSTEAKGQTALMWAAAEGHSMAVDTLIKAGADIRRRLDSGFDAMLFAVRNGHLETVRLFLEAGIDVDQPAPAKGGGKRMRSGTTALMLAVENGHFELALELATAGADPNSQNSGYAPLHALSLARKNWRGDGPNDIPPPGVSGSVGSLEFVKKIVAAGADPNIRIKSKAGGWGDLDTAGATPFLLAAANGDLPLMQALLEAGADPNIPTDEGGTPLLAAAGLGVHAPGEEPSTEAESIEVIAFLLARGADINAVDKRGETAMHCAAYKIAPALVAFLDEKGADIEIWNRKNRRGWTPLLITQGYRPGNFRPSKDTENAVAKVMRARGAKVAEAPPRTK